MLEVLIGTSLVGKTTYTNQRLKESKKLVSVSRDEERISLFGKYRFTTKEEEILINDIMKDRINRLIQNRFDVIVDGTHLSTSDIENYIKTYGHSCDIKVKVFPNVDIKLLIKRNQYRFDDCGKLIPRNVLEKQQRMLNELDLSLYCFEWDNIKTSGGEFIINKINRNVEFNYDENKKNCFIFDLDGTLSYSPQRDFYGFDEELIYEDKVIEPVAKVLRALFDEGHKIVFVSGREDKYKEQTIKWLNDKVLKFNAVLFYNSTPYEIFMRETGDYRSDVIIKNEIYKTNIKPFYNVVGVFDDRKNVCESWLRKGLFLFDVSQDKGYF
jgi:predicted kinase